MIRVKNNGTYTLHVSPTEPVEVTEGFIRPYFGEKGIIGYEILFSQFGEPVIIEPAIEAVPAVEADPENGIEGSPAIEAKEAVIYIPEAKWGFYNYGQFECNHEDPTILLKCHQAAIEKLGEDWEIFNLNNI